MNWDLTTREMNLMFLLLVEYGWFSVGLVLYLTGYDRYVINHIVTISTLLRVDVPAAANMVMIQPRLWDKIVWALCCIFFMGIGFGLLVTLPAGVILCVNHMICKGARYVIKKTNLDTPSKDVTAAK
jgi:hypothetical protein